GRNESPAIPPRLEQFETRMLRLLVAGWKILFLRIQSLRRGPGVGSSRDERLPEEEDSQSHSAYDWTRSVRRSSRGKWGRTQTLYDFAEPQDRSCQLRSEITSIYGPSRWYARGNCKLFPGRRTHCLLHVGRKSLAAECGWQRAARREHASDSR